jgi:hypothetical protein
MSTSSISGRTLFSHLKFFSDGSIIDSEYTGTISSIAEHLYLMDLGSINNIDQQPSAKDNTRFVAILQAHPLLEYLLGQTTLKLNVLIFDPVPLEFTGLTILFSTGFKSTRCIPVVYIVDGQIGRKQFGQDLYREFRVQSKFEWIIPLTENNGKPSNLTPSHIRATTFLVTEYVKSSAYSSEDVNTNKISVSKDQNKRNHVTQVALSENFSIILKGLLQPIICLLYTSDAADDWTCV